MEQASEKIQEICIVGAGALGLATACLLSGSHKVRLLARPGNAPYSLTELKCRSPQNISPVHSNMSWISVSELGGLPSNTIYLICVKAYDLDKALSTVAPHLDRDSTVVLFQNGLGIFLQAAEIVGRRAPMIRALSQFGALKLSQKEVQISGSLALSLSAMPEDRPALDTIRLLFSGIGAEISLPDTVVQAEWEKVLINLAVNPLASLLNGPNGVVIESPDALSITRQVLAEARSVAAAEGVAIPVSDNAIITKIRNSSQNLNSTLMDIRSNKGSELPFITGRFLKLAESYGVLTPAIRLLDSICREQKG